MYAAADSNMNFQHGFFPSSFCNQHVGSFQAGTINSTAGLVQGGINCSVGGINSAADMMLAGNHGTMNSGSSMMLEGSSNGSQHLELLAGLKHDTGLVADWSYKEQALLSHGLIHFSYTVNIIKWDMLCLIFEGGSVILAKGLLQLSVIVGLWEPLTCWTA